MTITCPKCSKDFGRDKVALWRHIQAEDECFLAMEDHMPLNKDVENLIQQRMKKISEGDVLSTGELRRRLKAQQEKRRNIESRRN